MARFYSNLLKGVLCLMALTNANLSQAQSETITICDGTDENKYIPFWFYYLDNSSATSQVIYPASELNAIKGKQITGIKFYNGGYASTWNSNMAVSLAEVEYATLSTDNSDYITADFKEAFNGAVSGTEEMNTLEFEFQTPVIYTGQNLVVEVKNTIVGSTYMQVPFYGKNVEDMNAVYGYGSYSRYNQGFLPKITITYEEMSQYAANVSAEALNFSTIFTGETIVKTFTITNTGAADLVATISGVEAPYSVKETNLIIPSLTSVSVPVTFAPIEDGTYNQTMKINLGEAGESEISLAGTSMTAPTGYKQGFDVEDKTLPEKWVGWNVKSTYSYDIYDYVYESSEAHFDYFVGTEIDGTKAVTIYENANPRREYPSQYAIYMVSPVVAGNVMITARATNESEYTQGELKVYNAIENEDGTYLIGEPIDVSWTSPLTNAEWSNAIFCLERETRLAIMVSYGAVSMFAADKLGDTSSIEKVGKDNAIKCQLNGNTLVLSATSTISNYQIVSVGGTIVASGKAGSNFAKIGFDCPAGLYIVNVTTENGVSSYKVIKK